MRLAADLDTRSPASRFYVASFLAVTMVVSTALPCFAAGVPHVIYVTTFSPRTVLVWPRRFVARERRRPH